MAAMAAQVDALMAQLRTTSGVEPAPKPPGSTDKGASTSANLRLTSMILNTYNPMVLPPLPQLVNPGGM